MATNNPLFGWGSLKLSYGGQDVELTSAYSNLSFTPETTRNTTIAGEIIQRTNGWRGYIDSSVFNYDTDDKDKIATMLSIINSACFDGLPITIYPRYDVSDIGSNWSGTFHLDSNIQPAEIANNVSSGQTIQLRFIQSELESVMPSFFGTVETALRCYDSTDTTNVRVYDSTDATATRISS